MFEEVTRYFWGEDAHHKVGMLLCYCSVFDECWLTGLGQLGGIDSIRMRKLAAVPSPVTRDSGSDGTG
jgi:hypothetical protein